MTSEQSKDDEQARLELGDRAVNASIVERQAWTRQSQLARNVRDAQRNAEKKK